MYNLLQITPERLKARQLAKAKAFEEEMKKQTKAMAALVIGCIWWNPHTSGNTDPNYNKLAEFSVVYIKKSLTHLIILMSHHANST